MPSTWSALERLATEQPNPNTEGLDALEVGQALYLLNDEDQRVPLAVRQEVPAIADAVALVVRSLRSGGRLIYVGAGTSGRLGCLDASEIPPTFGMEPDRVLAIIAGGDGALRRSIEGAEDDPATGARSIVDANVGRHDTVCGIAASGRTPFVLGALAEARRLGAATVGLATNRPSEMEGMVDVMIAPDVGPEPVSGSTRMKSGTAQKLVLNMLTTMAMVRLGKTYGNLMVDLRPTNAKLVIRAERLIRNVTGCSPEEASRLFEASGMDTKAAILMGLTGVDAEAARLRLATASGLLRDALAGG